MTSRVADALLTLQVTTSNYLQIGQMFVKIYQQEVKLSTRFLISHSHYSIFFTVLINKQDVWQSFIMKKIISELSANTESGRRVKHSSCKAGLAHDT